MNQQKGFSLTEVLASLVLVTTLVVALVQQQWQNKYLLNQLIIRAQDTQFLGYAESTLLVPEKQHPSRSFSYPLKKQHKNQEKRIRFEKSARARRHGLLGSIL